MELKFSGKLTRTASLAALLTTSQAAYCAAPLTDKQMTDYHSALPLMNSLFELQLKKTQANKKALQQARLKARDHHTKLALLRKQLYGPEQLAVAEKPLVEHTDFTNADDWARVGDRVSCLQTGIMAVALSAKVSGQITAAEMENFPYYFSDNSKPAQKRAAFTQQVTKFVAEKGCTETQDVSLYLDNLARWELMAKGENDEGSESEE